jgi:hypothetical protein
MGSHRWEQKATGCSAKRTRGNDSNQMEIEMMMQSTDALTEQTLFCLNKLTCERTSFQFDGPPSGRAIWAQM